MPNYAYKASSGCLILVYEQMLPFGQPVITNAPKGSYGQKYFFDNYSTAFGVDPACGGTPHQTKGSPTAPAPAPSQPIPLPPVQDPCGPPLIDDPPPSVPSSPITGSGGKFGGSTGSGDGHGANGPGSRTGPMEYRRGSKYYWTQEEALAMPVIAGLTPINVYDEWTWRGKPEITNHGMLRKVDNSISVYHETTGPGNLVLHSPELQDWYLPGPGVLPQSAWTKRLSPAVLHLLNVERNGTTQDHALAHLQFGELVEGKQTPGRGWRVHQDPVSRDLCIDSYDADGDPDTAFADVKINGVVVPGGGGAVFGSNPTDIALAPGPNQIDAVDHDVVRLTGAASISGIENGRPTIILCNVDNFGIEILNQEGTADAETRIITGTGTGYWLQPNNSVVLWYDPTTDRWRIID